VQALGAADMNGDNRLDVVTRDAERTEVFFGVLREAISEDLNRDALPDECQRVAFRRGDPNQDGLVNLTDAVALLNYLFRAGEPILCRVAADANDDGKLNISDAITTLRHLFGGTGPLPPPSEECGFDPTMDALNCESYAPCE